LLAAKGKVNQPSQAFPFDLVPADRACRLYHRLFTSWTCHFLVYSNCQMCLGRGQPYRW
jgi:hypothetical protein